MEYSIVTDPESKRKIILHNVTIDENTLTSGELLDVIEDNVDYNDLQAIRYRATTDELLTFANKLRSAGGTSNFLSDLVPSIPTNKSVCLIANALNFNCEVNSDYDHWYMMIEGEESERIANGIHESLGLNYEIGREDYYDLNSPAIYATIYLPDNIGLVAKAFDSYNDYELEHFNIHSVLVDND